MHALAQAVEELNRGTAQDGDASRIPAPDLDKVCMIGWSYGGFLSALAVLDAPDVVKAACAGAPPHRLDAVRHALHRALPRARPGGVRAQQHHRRRAAA